MTDKGIGDLNFEAMMGHDIRFDADDAAPNYIGVSKDTVGIDTTPNWVIYKFTYSGGNVTRIQKQVGAWQDRASLTWA
jgi:hypothetical protein